MGRSSRGAPIGGSLPEVVTRQVAHKLSSQPAAVVGYDEESETYTVLHPDGRRSYFVSEEMIEKRR